jgi:uncharacterized protein YyaL (SSP411 family)
LLQIIAGTNEIAIGGKRTAEIHKKTLAEYIPHRILMTFQVEDERFPLTNGKPVADTALIFLCRNFTCLKPVSTVSELISLINNGRSNK